MTPSIWRRIAAFFRRPAIRRTGLIIFFTVKWLLIGAIVSGFMAGGAAFGYLAAVLKDEPVRSRQEIQEQIRENIVTGFVYFNDATPVGQLRTEEDRRLAELKDIPQKLLDATLAIEDKDFYKHFGFDFNGVFRAAKQKVLNEEVQTGGSTITQQLARRVFLTLDRDITRKFKEIILSVRLERILSKDEILLAYLNKIPYGSGSSGYTVYGIKAAAKGLFDKDDLNGLNIAQSAYLAGLPQLPSSYSAFTGKGEFDSDGFKRAVKRQQLVLKRMLEESKITQQEYDEALAFDLKSSLAKSSQKAYTTYPYLMMEVERKAAEAMVKVQYPDLKLDTQSKKNAYTEALKDAQNQLLRGGYHIYTTIDKTIYDTMQEIAKNPKNFSPDLPNKGKDGLEQIGGIMIDNKTGAILGMMEGRDFYTEQLNHATQAYRQPGSTMKPIAAYIPAMEKGAIQPGSVIDDVPIVLPDGQKGVHLPENWDYKFHGLITARQALNQSYNIPAIKLFLYQVGIKEAWDYAARMGITTITKEDMNAQTGVIGGLSKGVSVEEMTNAYTTIPNQGVFYDAYMIEKITDSQGKVVFQHETKPARIYSEQTAYLMTDMLRTVITSGTATDLMTKFKYYKKVAVSGKTGSTQDDADAWFMGYTPDITVGVWAGYDQPVNKLSKNTGGTYRAKSVWALIMNEAYEKRPELFPTKQFEKPQDIIEMSVSGVSGKLPNELTAAAGRTVTDLFNKKFVPTQEDDVMVKTKTIAYNGVNYIPQPSTPDDFLEEKTVIRREKSIAKILNEVKDAIEKLPEDKKKPLDRFVPVDADEDAPSETDPRTDDGTQPATPENLLVARSGDGNRITFQPVSAPDIIGYRLYRSADGGPFAKVSGKVLLTGQDPVFQDAPSGGGRYSYYVTAVDVAGRESVPGKSASADGQVRDVNDPAKQGLPGTDLLPGGLPGGTGSGASSKPGSSGGATAVPAAPAGLKITTKGVSIQLSWNANPAEDKVKLYTIYTSDKENGTYKKLGTSNGTEFMYYAASDEGYYRITAANDAGESPPGKTVHYKKTP
ncbi:transglycosylase domain-containing protein [Gorillibacterium sp. sgz5001074]|uniref:transglycosylase domain-containing protein n=1 Tax=Gorillibacterium sp. sgz5001074 TaxID=3446695 RepID=UPI003F681CFD